MEAGAHFGQGVPRRRSVVVVVVDYYPSMVGHCGASDRVRMRLHSLFSIYTQKGRNKPERVVTLGQLR